MPQEGQDLFSVMDSALKRQREAGPQDAKGGAPRPSSRRQAPGETPAPLAAAAAQAPKPAPPAAQPPAAPEPPPPAPDGPPASNSITQRFQQRADPAKLVPAPGSLKPGEVLRGTFFSGGLSGRSGSGLQPPPQPPTSVPAPPAAPAQFVPKAGPVAPARPLAGGIYRPSTRAGVVAGIGAPAPVPAAPATVPLAAVPPPAQAPAAPLPSVRAGSVRIGSSRLEPVAPRPAAQPHGFFVPTKVAVVAVLGVATAMVVFYFLGYTIAEKKLALKSPPKIGRPAGSPPDGLKPPPVSPGNLRPIPGIERGGSLPPPPPPPPPAAPKFTVKVRIFLPDDRNSAVRLLNNLRARREFADARLLERGSGGSVQLIVCVGRFDRLDDPRAEQLRRAVQAFDSRLRSQVIQE